MDKSYNGTIKNEMSLDIKTRRSTLHPKNNQRPTKTTLPTRGQHFSYTSPPPSNDYGESFILGSTIEKHLPAAYLETELPNKVKLLTRLLPEGFRIYDPATHFRALLKGLKVVLSAALHCVIYLISQHSI